MAELTIAIVAHNAEATIGQAVRSACAAGDSQFFWWRMVAMTGR